MSNNSTLVVMWVGVIAVAVVLIVRETQPQLSRPALPPDYICQKERAYGMAGSATGSIVQMAPTATTNTIDLANNAEVMICHGYVR